MQVSAYRVMVTILGIALLAGPAQASWVTLDDFNGYSPGSTLGAPNWTAIDTSYSNDGSLVCYNGGVTSSGTERAHMAYANPSSLSLANTIRFHATHTPSDTYAGQYVGGIVGYNSLTGKFLQVRLQSTSSTTGFTSLYFYDQNGQAWANMGGTSYANFATGNGIADIEVTIDLTGTILTVSLNWDADPEAEFTATRTVDSSVLGSGIGLTTYMTSSQPNRPRIDDVEGFVVLPEPALLVSMALGSVCLHRRRKRMVLNAGL